MATLTRRKSAAKPQFGLVLHRDAGLQALDHRILAACKVASVEIETDDNGRPSATFVLAGKVTRDVDRVVCRLEGMRSVQAARRKGGAQ